MGLSSPRDRHPEIPGEVGAERRDHAGRRFRQDHLAPAQIDAPDYALHRAANDRLLLRHLRREAPAEAGLGERVLRQRRQSHQGKAVRSCSK